MRSEASLPVPYQENRLNTLLGTITQSAVFIYQLIAVLVFVGSLFAAYAWLKNPFIGGFFEQTMVLNEQSTRQAGKQWALQKNGFRFGDQLESVGGLPVRNANDVRLALEHFHVGYAAHVV